MKVDDEKGGGLVLDGELYMNDPLHAWICVVCLSEKLAQDKKRKVKYISCMFH